MDITNVGVVLVSLDGNVHEITIAARLEPAPSVRKEVGKDYNETQEQFWSRTREQGTPERVKRKSRLTESLVQGGVA
eukprot:scaffold6506_cov171-Amphora_coffeaeformis.AAC.3